MDSKPIKPISYLPLIAIPLIAVFWFNSAHSSSIAGVTVDIAGSTSTVGITSGDKIKYYIPLDESTAGTYGATSSTCANGVGTCSDSGSGFGYDDASALEMNIYFNLTGKSPITFAELDFVFDDLDLTDINDPYQFYESMSLSYWDGSNFDSLNAPTIIKSSGDMNGVVDASAEDPISWNLDLAAILGDLNDSQSNYNGFWIQFGFGSDYYRTGSNTPEYLTASLNLTPVPVPAAFWMFGTALIGFVGFSRRTTL